MRLAKNACLALVCSAALSTMGCCYHAKNFGHARHVGICEVGCGTCSQSNGCCTDSVGVRTNTTEPIPAPKTPPQRPERLP